MLIYPAIDLLGGRCVRLRQGDYAQETVFSDNPAAVAREWVRQGADRLHVVDLDGAKSREPVNGATIQRIVEAAGVPVQLGGGIRSEEHLRLVFGWGVRWAVLGSKALQDPDWVKRMAYEYPDRIVLGLDARAGFVATEGWLETSTTKATDLAKLGWLQGKLTTGPKDRDVLAGDPANIGGIFYFLLDPDRAEQQLRRFEGRG